MRIYDYVTADGVNSIKEWAGGLDVRSLAALNNKFRMLEQAAPSLLPGLIRGFNIQGQKHIGKLAIGGSGSGRALRPLICRGPVDNDEEITVLVGAEEKGGKLPAGIGKEAERRRQQVIADPTKRRCKHEPVAKPTRC